MDTPDIKAGTYYNLKLLCVLSKDNFVAFETPSGRYMPLRQCDLECVSPITPSEPPKYDPCRLFKKGDMVRIVKHNGRIKPYLKDFVGKVYVLGEDEDHKQVTYIGADDIESIDVCHLELVTPVVEPYCIADHIHGWIVYKDTPGNVVANFNKTHPHAKEAAEAERDRLNDEYRKEQQ